MDKAEINNFRISGQYFYFYAESWSLFFLLIHKESILPIDFCEIINLFFFQLFKNITFNIHIFD